MTGRDLLSRKTAQRDRAGGRISLMHRAMVFGMVLWPVWCAGAAGTGSISGAVHTVAGKPLPASVTLHDLSTPRVAGQTPFDRRFGSKSDGSFLLTGVPQGRYEICVEAPQEAVLDPCLWGQSGRPPAPIVTVTDGGSVSGLDVPVETGAVLRVRVNDRDGLLPRTRTGADPKALSLAVITNAGRYLNLRMLSGDDSGQEHFLVVPFDESVTLHVQSSLHALSDENHAPYTGNSKEVPIRVSRGSVLAEVVVNVERR
jgi:hypothetical protein